ncbi:MAG: glycosyltransferase family 4 protein [Alphaproteobacteria bacterium]|nr:glycosyltransferase family 4 protein [Alphaproteobacteria bacterium]
MTGRKRFLFIASDYASFVSHKSELARAAIEAGFEVTIAANPGQGEPASLPGTRLVPLTWTRGGSAARAFVKAIPEILEIRRLIATVDPDVVHAIDLKPAIVASLASWGRCHASINSINGLGFVFVDQSWPARLIQALCGWVLRRAAAAGARIVVQNGDDDAVLRSTLVIPAASLEMIRGSGVDPEAYQLSPPPEAPPTVFLILSRLLYIKGIQDAVAAVERLRLGGIKAELVIAGAPDPGNPSSIPDSVLKSWSAVPGVRLVGHVNDVRSLIAGAHIVLQPSHGGEGLPRALLEAAAAARPLIATDVPGNREIVRHQETGLLVPPKDPTALASAMARLANDPAGCRQWGLAARALLKSEFAAGQVRDRHLALYRRAAGLDS